MGRYYHGNVEGKFMFAIQSSDAHTRFGAVELEPSHIDYIVYRDNYKEICAELESIEKSGHINKVEKMFKENVGYNNERMEEYNVTEKDLSEWADYQIGKQLKKFFDDNPTIDECNFEAEL